jgi:hypothetical protein
MLPKFVRYYFSKAAGKEGCPFCSQTKSDACAEGLLQFASAREQIYIEPSCGCPVLPLYLQWEGHSITIVGIDASESLLVFDPLKDGAKMKKDLNQKRIPKEMKLSSKSLLRKDIQVVMTSRRSLTHTEKEARKEEPSVVTAAKEYVLRAVNA